MADASQLAVGFAVIIAVFGSFFVSASAGLGGSLVLVPTLALVVGTKEGVALAEDAICSGAAKEKLASLIQFSQACA